MIARNGLKTEPFRHGAIMRDDWAKEREARSNGRNRHKGPSMVQTAARDRARSIADAAGPDAIEIIPYGRSREEQAKLDRVKAGGRRGWNGCLSQLVVLALIAVYWFGWSVGRH